MISIVVGADPTGRGEPCDRDGVPIRALLGSMLTTEQMSKLLDLARGTPPGGVVSVNVEWGIATTLSPNGTMYEPSEPKTDLRLILRGIRHEPGICGAPIRQVWVANRAICACRDERVASVLVAALRLLAAELYRNNEVQLYDLIAPLADLSTEGRVANEYVETLLEEVASILTELREV